MKGPLKRGTDWKEIDFSEEFPFFNYRAEHSELLVVVCDHENR